MSVANVAEARHWRTARLVVMGGVAGSTSVACATGTTACARTVTVFPMAAAYPMRVVFVGAVRQTQTRAHVRRATTSAGVATGTIHRVPTAGEYLRAQPGMMTVASARDKTTATDAMV